MAKRFRFGIRTKLIAMINIVLLIAAAAIVISATRLFSQDNVTRIQEANLDSARLLAKEVSNNFTNLTEKMRLLGVLSLQELAPEAREALEKPFFEGEQDLLAETVIAPGRKGPPLGRAVNGTLLKSLDVTIEDIQRLQGRIRIDRLLSGGVIVEPGELKGGIPVLTLGIPLMVDDSGTVVHAALATVKQERFLRSFEGTGITTSYLVNADGYLLAHPEHERVLRKENVAHLEIVKLMLSGKNNNGQKRFADPASKQAFLGAYKTVGFAGIGVVSQVPEAKALEAARKVETISILITGMVAVVAFLTFFFYSLSMTQPILRLVDATQEVAAGRYDISLRKGSNDEIGDLTKAFGEMAQGLAEREKIKSAFSKFHSKEVAEKILSGQLSLTGERKEALVFFSDVRGFTAMSEKLEPEALVKILNRYMTRMVRVILSHGGIVDKYVGDAIMAVWGAPISKEGDVESAMMACLGMRVSLAELNIELVAEGLPALRIGMGLNYGPLISGNIGSEERMEYTVIGDTVNTASRIESLTKEFGTDFLVSQAVLDKVPGRFIVEKAHEVKVKGKTEPLAVFKVHGYVDAAGNTVIVETPYSSYQAEKSDKVVHDDVTRTTTTSLLAPGKGYKINPLKKAS